jgi:hypothetical protein
MHSIAADRKSASESQGKRPDQALNAWGVRNAGSHPRLPCRLPGNLEKRYHSGSSEESRMKTFGKYI